MQNGGPGYSSLDDYSTSMNNYMRPLKRRGSGTRLATRATFALT